MPETECSVLQIPVPSQNKLHKQWCLFDDLDKIDFDQEVRKIAGPAAEQRDLTNDDDETDANSVTERNPKSLAFDNEEVFEYIDYEDESSDSNSAFTNEDFLAELTLLDVQSPVKRQLDPLFSDFSKVRYSKNKSCT